MRAVKIIGWIVVGLVVAVALGLALGFAVMWLWNWLMPAIFKLPAITFWQAVGLLVLSQLLLKSHISSQHERNKGNRAKWDVFAKRVKTAVEDGAPPTPPSATS
jgi:hypothetical protein